jgi:hypothetical protein
MKLFPDQENPVCMYLQIQATAAFEWYRLVILRQFLRLSGSAQISIQRYLCIMHLHILL